MYEKGARRLPYLLEGVVKELLGRRTAFFRLLLGGDFLVHDDADRVGAVVERDEPSAATFVLSLLAPASRGFRYDVLPRNASKNGTPARFVSFPYMPAPGKWAQFATRTVLEILGAQQAGTSARVHDVVEFDRPTAARLAAPRGTDGPANVGQRRFSVRFNDAGVEVDRTHFDAVKDFGTALLGVAEHDLVCLETYHVSGSVVLIGRTEIRG